MSPHIFPNEDLTRQASHAAKEQSHRQIRAALREVALQCLRSSWSMSPQDLRLNLTISSIENVQNNCREFVSSWSQRLENSGQKKIAEWVRQIGNDHVSSLYFDEEMSLSSQNNPSESIPGPEKKSTDAYLTNYTRLRKLGSFDVLAPENQNCDPTSLAEKVDQKGRLNRTEWPFDWSIIQQTTQNIESRLYKSSQPAMELEIIPKSVASSNSQSTERNNEETKEWWLARKRKSASRERRPPKRSVRIPSSETIDLTHRPPNETHHCLLSTNDLLPTEYEVATVGTDEQAVILLGQLQPLASFHTRLQDSIDTPKANSMRRHRQAWKERLGDHKADGGEFSTFLSHVQRATAGKQSWIDFDLGQCVLEVEENRYLFQNVEVMALDEDDDPNETAAICINSDTTPLQIS